MNNKKLTRYLIIVLIIVLIGIGMYRYTDFFKDISLPQIPKIDQTEVEVEEELELPQGWEKTVEDGDEVVVKLTKQTESEVATNIVLTKVEDIDYENSEDYTDRLIAGTKSSLPSLTYTEDEIEENDYFVRKLEGRYWNEMDRVDIKQRIYLTEDTVYVLTASFDHQLDSEELNNQINQNFDLLEENYIEL